MVKVNRLAAQARISQFLDREMVNGPHSVRRVVDRHRALAGGDGVGDVADDRAGEGFIAFGAVVEERRDDVGDGLRAGGQDHRVGQRNLHKVRSVAGGAAYGHIDRQIKVQVALAGEGDFAGVRAQLRGLTVQGVAGDLRRRDHGDGQIGVHLHLPIVGDEPEDVIAGLGKLQDVGQGAGVGECHGDRADGLRPGDADRAGRAGAVIVRDEADDLDRREDLNCEVGRHPHHRAEIGGGEAGNLCRAQRSREDAHVIHPALPGIQDVRRALCQR